MNAISAILCESPPEIIVAALLIPEWQGSGRIR